MLTPRQREVRKALVKSKGLIQVRDLADRFKVGRVSIWRDMQAIRKIRPVHVDDFTEEAEISESLAWFDTMEAIVLDELTVNEVQCQEHAGHVVAIGFLNVRCNLLGQLRSVRSDRQDFLLKIGYIKEAPKRFHLETPISEMSKAELDDEITELDKRIIELEGGLGNDTARAVEGEAEALPLPPEEDDRVQGT